jgi:hypothetical protein
MAGISEEMLMKSWLLLPMTVLALLLTPQQVPGAATQPLPHSAPGATSVTSVARELDLALRRLSQTLPQSRRVQPAQLQQIEDLWQQLFALNQSHLLNKLYNQYQVQLQQARQSTSGIAGEDDVRQMTALRQRLMAAITAAQP